MRKSLAEMGLIRMDTTTETTGALSRRRLLLAGAALVAVAAAGGTGYWYFSRPGAAQAEVSAGADVPMADLMVPGPLGDYILGSADAPVTIVEYASLTCPHCAHFHETTYPEMKKKYIDTGKVRFISASSRSMRWRQRARCWRAAPARTSIFP